MFCNVRRLSCNGDPEDWLATLIYFAFFAVMQCALLAKDRLAPLIYFLANSFAANTRACTGAATCTASIDACPLYLSPRVGAARHQIRMKTKGETSENGNFVHYHMNCTLIAPKFAFL